MKKIISIIILLMFTAGFVTIAIKGIYWFAASKRPQIMGTAYIHVNTDKKVVALTYDDGPNPPFTDSILDILHKRNIKATFFVVGERAENHLALLYRMQKDGHEIGNHSWSHHDLIFRSPFYVAGEIEKTDSIIKSTGYTNKIHFRAPKGFKLVVLPWILSRTDRTHILFDVVPMDWEETRVKTMLNNVCCHVHPGAIILLHDGGGDRSATIQLTKSVIDTLSKQGYQFVTVSQLLSYQKTSKGVTK